MKHRFILIFILSLASATFAHPQAPAREGIDSIIGGAKRQADRYREAFKNLIAVELKTFELFGKGGQIKETRTVESNFLVYQSSRNDNVSSELRSVYKVDGKLVPDAAERSDRLFGELQKSTTMISELDKIQKESNRYDKTLEITGLTLYEAVILLSNMRPCFDFELKGTEEFQGREVYVVAYRQVKQSPYILFNDNKKNPDSLTLYFDFKVPGSLKHAEAFLSGKLWIDTGTHQIWREERIVGVRAEDPVPISETTFEYQPSKYEILVPKSISLLQNKIKEKNKKYIAEKDVKVSFEYSEFKKSETDVKIVDDTKPD